MVWDKLGPSGAGIKVTTTTSITYILTLGSEMDISMQNLKSQNLKVVIETSQQWSEPQLNNPRPPVYKVFLVLWDLPEGVGVRLTLSAALPCLSMTNIDHSVDTVCSSRPVKLSLTGWERKENSTTWIACVEVPKPETRTMQVCLKSKLCWIWIKQVLTATFNINIWQVCTISTLYRCTLHFR